MPDEAVLRFEHPVPFVGEVKEFAGNAAHLGGGVGFHTLPFRHAEVHATMNHQDRRIPFVYQTVWAELGIGLGLGLEPIGPARFVVGKEQLFRSAEHALQIVHPAVADEGLEALLVDTRQIVDGVPAVAGTHGTEFGTVYIG